MSEIRVAIAGIGNCASSLIQGIHYYTQPANIKDPVGLLHPVLGSYMPGDIKIVAAIDIDARKVGRPLHEAVFALPNNTKTFFKDFAYPNLKVTMGNVLDGVSEHFS